jgi:hypothetical protein
MQTRIGLALVACALAGAAAAETRQKPALLSSLSLAPGEGLAWDYARGLAVHDDGSVGLALSVERRAGQETRRQLLALTVDTKGALAARIPLGPEAKLSIDAVVAADRDGFAVAKVEGGEKVTVYRIARGGQLRAEQPIRFRRDSINELRGIDADARGNLLLYGGVGSGPFAPAIAGLDPRGRVAWQFFGKEAMPPGGVVVARFRPNGGSDAITIDREKPYWERRSAAGALLMRRPLDPVHHDCRAFLDDRLVDVFYNWAEQPLKTAPARQWVLTLTGPDAQVQPGHVSFDLPERESASCRLAAHDAGWIALALQPGKIMVLDGTLARRAEIDLPSPSDTHLQALAIDASGSVVALVDTGSLVQGRTFSLLRFAPLAR